MENLERELDVYKTYAVEKMGDHKVRILTFFLLLCSKKEKELASLIEVRNKANRELSAADAKVNMVLQNYNKQKREADSE